MRFSLLKLLYHIQVNMPKIQFHKIMLTGFIYLFFLFFIYIIRVMLLCLFRCRFVWINATNKQIRMLMLMEQCTKDRHSTLFILCEQEYFSKTFSLFFFLYTRKKKFRSMALLRSRHSAHPITLALDKLHRIIRPDCWYVCVYVGLCPCMCVCVCMSIFDGNARVT